MHSPESNFVRKSNIAAEKLISCQKIFFDMVEQVIAYRKVILSEKHMFGIGEQVMFLFLRSRFKCGREAFSDYTRKELGSKGVWGLHSQP